LEERAYRAGKKFDLRICENCGRIFDPAKESAFEDEFVCSDGCYDNYRAPSFADENRFDKHDYGLE
jgi:formylmethanofuran dehydrogenase subunit E